MSENSGAPQVPAPMSSSAEPETWAPNVAEQLANDQRLAESTVLFFTNVEARGVAHPDQDRLRLAVGVMRASAAIRVLRRREAQRDDLLPALKLLLADVQDYEAWQRPCHAVDVARAAVTKAEGSSEGPPSSEAASTPEAPQ